MNHLFFGMMAISGLEREPATISKKLKNKNRI